jgi:selenocysteine lyase/cysteine desulfurase
MTIAASTSFFSTFAKSLHGPDHVQHLRDGLIGEGAEIEGPFGRRKLVYADYVASGRALLQVERFMMEEVLPFYANSHTEASYCGERMTRMRREARAIIARACGADESFATVFTGSGATAGLNRLVGLFGVCEAAAGPGAVVFIGPYEHHSNILPWRESGAEVVEIPEAEAGGPDLVALADALSAAPAGALKIGAFSAASNVTGIVTDPEPVTRLLKAQGALAVWD